MTMCFLQRTKYRYYHSAIKRETYKVRFGYKAKVDKNNFL